MVDQTRFPKLWAILTLLSGNAKAKHRRQAAAIREKALSELQEAMRRRDTRLQHEKAAKAVAATSEALRAGA